MNTVEFAYNDFSYKDNLPIMMRFCRSQQNSCLLHASEFDCNDLAISSFHLLQRFLSVPAEYFVHL